LIDGDEELFATMPDRLAGVLQHLLHAGGAPPAHTRTSAVAGGFAGSDAPAPAYFYPPRLEVGSR
jgi:hypothetical protein